MKQLVLLIFIFSYSFVTGQLEFHSLDELFAYADTHATQILSAEFQTRMNASKNKAAQTALLPSVNASAGFNDNIRIQPTLVPANLLNPAAPEGTFNEYTFGRTYMYSTGIQASWDILNFQKLFQTKVTKAQLNVSEATSLQVKHETYDQLAQTYYGILLTKEYLTIGKQNLEIADSLLNSAENKYSQGIIQLEALNRIKIQQIQIIQNVESIQHSLEQSENQLQVLLNVKEEIVLTEQVVSDQLKQQTVFDTNPQDPEVLLAEAQLKLAETQLQQARSLQYPSLTLAYQYNFNWSTDRMFDLSNSNKLPQEFLGVKLNIPVFNGFDVKQKVKQSKLGVEQQHLLLESQLLAVEKEDENRKIQYLQALESLKRQREVMILQNEIDQHAENKYQNGILSLDERLDKFKDLLNAQNQYVSSLSDYYISYYVLVIRTMNE